MGVSDRTEATTKEEDVMLVCGVVGLIYVQAFFFDALCAFCTLRSVKVLVGKRTFFSSLFKKKDMFLVFFEIFNIQSCKQSHDHQQDDCHR